MPRSRPNTTQQIAPERLKRLNSLPVRANRYVLYWMQASQREACNHALEYAIQEANARGVPALAVFGLMDDYPEANLRHYAFMLEGLAQTALSLRARGVQLVVLRDHPVRAAAQLAGDACLLVTDRGYTRHQRAWRQELAQSAHCLCVQVESDVIVPVESASQKMEYSAATIRPRIHKNLPRFLVGLAPTPLAHDSLGIRAGGVEISQPARLLKTLKLDRSVPPSPTYCGGRQAACACLDDFIAHRLKRYHTQRNDPSLDIQSHVSPYLHFGQISPLEVALRILSADAPKAARDAYLEELIVRRELSVNFTCYCPGYDVYDQAVPDWARQSLAQHRRDDRPIAYSAEQLDAAATHDPYWNAAQREMTLTGKMHNYMRMYWGKKIIEWTQTPQEAFARMIHLNNRYFLDGRDPASWTNVAWCLGRHDRPWQERAIFGKVRYMNAAGLQRKFNIDAYVAQVDALPSRAR